MFTIIIKAMVMPLKISRERKRCGDGAVIYHISLAIKIQNCERVSNIFILIFGTNAKKSIYQHWKICGHSWFEGRIGAETRAW